MQDSIRRLTAASAAAAMIVFLGAPLSALATSESEVQVPSFDNVTFFDGTSWLGIPMAAGSFEGPAGGNSPTARLKADLGGPKTYFTLAGAQSEAKVSVARPRFRFSAGEASAHCVQLAQFEVKDETRRTTIEITKNVTVFKRGSELEVTKVSEGVYEVRPKKSLQPGEYALVISETGPVADFTIVERGY
jgi:hypothetical protein